MNDQDAFDKFIIPYVEGTLAASDRAAFEEMLAKNPSLRIKLNDFKSMDNVLKTIRAEDPSENFTARVMQAVRQPAVFRPSGWSVVFLLAVVALIVGAGILSTMGFFDSVTTIALDNETVRYVQYLPSVAVNLKMLIKGVVFLNLVAALIVFDRSILKPFFRLRMQSRG
jgi:anti-sigma factor RsiW